MANQEAKTVSGCVLFKSKFGDYFYNKEFGITASIKNGIVQLRFDKAQLNLCLGDIAAATEKDYQDFKAKSGSSNSSSKPKGNYSNSNEKPKGNYQNKYQNAKQYQPQQNKSSYNNNRRPPADINEDAFQDDSAF